jgi:hypothetical protein
MDPQVSHDILHPQPPSHSYQEKETKLHSDIVVIEEQAPSIILSFFCISARFERGAVHVPQ